VFFEEENHPVLVRNGRNVLLEAKIPFSMAVLGHTITVPTIEGRANLKVPPGIQSGQVLRMKGKGFAKLRSNQRGDQLIKIQVVTPKDLSKKSRALVKEFSESESEKKIKYGKVKIE
jgi:molecular chaperone DnaJ